jgi:drug/metabolite transporter (DMT)-like permease
MRALALFCLGIVVGTIVTRGVEKTTNWQNLAKVFVAIFSAVFAGAVFTFIDKFASAEDLKTAGPYYVIGLLYGLLWFYTPAAIEHCKTEGLRIIGWMHIVGLAASVVVGFLIFFCEPFRNSLPH